MGESTQFLRTNIWSVIGASSVLTLGLAMIGQAQTAAFVACVVGILVMWKSELHSTAAPAPDTD